MKKGLFIFIVSNIMIFSQLSAEKKIITVDEIIKRLDQTDPEIAASRFRVIAARKTAEKANSAYYPKIELQGLVPVPGGMPGSYGEIGVRGVMISPFHTGNSIGFLGTYTLFDFGRTKNAVKAAEQDELTKKEEARIARIHTIQNTLHIYYDCIKLQSLSEVWKEKRKRLKFIQQEVIRFVSTGQRSVVDSYMIKSHVERIETQLKIFEAQYVHSQDKLSLLLSIPADEMAYASADRMQEPPSSEGINFAENPFIKKAESDLLTSKAKLDAAKAGNLPEIKSMGSIGDYDSARVVPKQNWAVGIGFSMPLFEGFKIQKEIEEAEAFSSQKLKELEAARKNTQETNMKIQEAIDTSKIRLKHLVDELKIAEEGYRVASSRYSSFQGTLIDLRETIINLYRVKAEVIDAKVQLNLYRHLLYLVNGNL